MTSVADARGCPLFQKKTARPRSQSIIRAARAMTGQRKLWWYQSKLHNRIRSENWNCFLVMSPCPKADDYGFRCWSTRSQGLSIEENTVPIGSSKENNTLTQRKWTQVIKSIIYREISMEMIIIMFGVISIWEWQMLMQPKIMTTYIERTIWAIHDGLYDDWDGSKSHESHCDYFWIAVDAWFQ